MGLIIANAFNRPVILLSSIQSFTIPPQFSPPSASSSPIILLYHSNHFEAAHLKSDSPLPPLYPAWRWVPDTEDLWTSHFNKKISIWQGILELEAELEKDSEIKITNLKLEAVPQLSASMEDMKKKGSNEDEDEDEDNLDLFLDDEYFDPDGAACLVKLPENDHYFIGMCYGDIEDDSCHVCYFTDDLVLMEKKMLLSTLVIPFKPSSKEILKTIKMVTLLLPFFDLRCIRLRDFYLPNFCFYRCLPRMVNLITQTTFQKRLWRQLSKISGELHSIGKFLKVCFFKIRIFYASIRSE